MDNSEETNPVLLGIALEYAEKVSKEPTGLLHDLCLPVMCGTFVRVGDTDFVCTRSPGHYGRHVAELPGGEIVGESGPGAVEMANTDLDNLLAELLAEIDNPWERSHEWHDITEGLGAEPLCGALFSGVCSRCGDPLGAAHACVPVIHETSPGVWS